MFRPSRTKRSRSSASSTIHRHIMSVPVILPLKRHSPPSPHTSDDNGPPPPTTSSQPNTTTTPYPILDMFRRLDKDLDEFRASLRNEGMRWSDEDQREWEQFKTWLFARWPDLREFDRSSTIRSLNMCIPYAQRLSNFHILMLMALN